jgi:Tfp pilus assembly protein PilX
MKCLATQRGSILLYAMIAMTIMLAIGLAIVSLFIGEMKIISAAKDSIISLYVADSAAEMCIYAIRQETSVAPITFTNGATYQIVSNGPGNPDITNECEILSSTSFGFRATGTFRGIRRTLEISQ